MATLTSRRAGFASTARPASLVGWVFSRLSLHASRQSLDALDDHLLDDIGVTRHQARREARRPVWDVPAHWRG